MIIYQNGIALSARGTAFISSNEISPPKEPKLVELIANNPWAPWGSDNLLPKQMVADIEACGVLAAAIDGKARFGLGKGVMPFKIASFKPDGSEELEPVINPDITDWIEESNLYYQAFGLLKDIIGFANYHVRLKFSNDGTKIGLVIRDDVAEMRYARENEAGKITHTYLSGSWELNPSETDKTLIKTELLPNIGTTSFLQSIPAEQRKGKEYAITGKVPGWLRHYYSQPTWYAAKKWVDIAKGVPAMKAAMFQNNIRIKYIVVIYDSFWSRVHGEEWNSYPQEKKEQIRTAQYDSIDSFLAGTDNAYKSVFVPGMIDPVSGKAYQDIEIKPIEDSTKQGELLPDSAAANSEILFALMMNPALMGADTPGGPYSGGAGSGSNIREAALIQVMIQEFERQQISRILNIVKKINGWDNDIVWRFPGLVLTTLDTGKSTKPVNS